jgi:hypothetical protein
MVTAAPAYAFDLRLNPGTLSAGCARNLDAVDVDSIERMFDYSTVQRATTRRLNGLAEAELGVRTIPPLPVLSALDPLLPTGLRRGSTVSVFGSVSLMLALLGAASAGGSWCALVGLPPLSAEAATEYGVDLSRLALVPEPGSAWATAVAALLDAVDVVVVRPPPRLVPGDVRRLASRARTRQAVLMPFECADWLGADLRLSAREPQWSGIADGYGRLRQRRVTVTMAGRGQAARPRSVALWLPAAGGGIQPVQPRIAAVPAADAQLAESTQPAQLAQPAELTRLAERAHARRVQHADRVPATKPVRLADPAEPLPQAAERVS